jgi:hypothetical protein
LQCGGLQSLTRLSRSYLPVPEPGPVGVKVDPLGEVLMAGFPDGFRPLLDPAAALPALLPVPPVVEVPVVVVPFMEEPVVVPVAAELPPAEPPPLWANANVLVSVRAAANPIVMSLMFSFLSVVFLQRTSS